MLVMYDERQNDTNIKKTLNGRGSNKSSSMDKIHKANNMGEQNSTKPEQLV
jgi:hypothetical protein